MRTLLKVTTAFFLLSAAAMPLPGQADPLSVDVGATVNGLGKTVSGIGGKGVSAKADVDVNLGSGGIGATGSIGTAAPSVAKANANVDVNLLDGATKNELQAQVTARIRALDKRSLVKLCISLGGKGCSTASRAALVKLNISLLPRATTPQLVDICVGIGARCGGGSGGTGAPGKSGSGTAGDSGVPGPVAVGARISSGKSDGGNKKKGCKAILSNPIDYEPEIVQMCRTILIR